MRCVFARWEATTTSSPRPRSSGSVLGGKRVPNPGMGIRFDQMSHGHRAPLEKIVRWIAIAPTIPQPELDRLSD